MHPYASFLAALDPKHRLSAAEARRALWARPDAPPLPPLEPLSSRPSRVVLGIRRRLSGASGA